MINNKSEVKNFEQHTLLGASLKGALNPNFLNFTKNREKLCL